MFMPETLGFMHFANIEQSEDLKKKQINMDYIYI